MLRNTPNNESIIVEYGFVDSAGDDVSQIKNNWEELTEAVVRALADYVGVTYIPPEGDTSNYYIVKSGDTLYSIARNYGVTVNALKSLNNLESNILTIGMRLVIPVEDSIDTSNIYTVQPGDTLYKIANKYGMTVNELKTLNNLTSNLLNIGQQLKVLETEENIGNTYVVKSGDSLYNIAKRYNVSVDALKAINNKTTNLLSIGEILTIPVSDINSYRTYIVVPGDTLWSIARKYNTSVDAIKSLNGLSSNILNLGMVLKIPS